MPLLVSNSSFTALLHQFQLEDLLQRQLQSPSAAGLGTEGDGELRSRLRCFGCSARCSIRRPIKLLVARIPALSWPAPRPEGSCSTWIKEPQGPMHTKCCLLTFLHLTQPGVPTRAAAPGSPLPKASSPNQEGPSPPHCASSLYLVCRLKRHQNQDLLRWDK